MKATEVTEGVWRLSANVDNLLFEGIWPIPHGIAMNSYIVKGEKCAIIDGVCGWDGVPETLFAQLDEMDIKLDDIEAVVVNHLEPDHTGWLASFKKLKDDFTIYTSAKGAELITAFYGIDHSRIHEVSSGDQLDLGDGRVFVFEEIPNVHWPETIATYDTKSKTLFPCDAFGSFGSVTDAPYDDQLTDEQIAFFESEAERYYSNIVGAFSVFVQRAVKKLEPLEIKIIAPAHGVVWRQNPGKILGDYIRYAGYSKGPAKPEVTVIWSSMYGMTETAVAHVVEGIESEGIKARVFRVPETHLSYVLASVWETQGVVIGVPTYEYAMFPPMVSIVDELGRKKAQNRNAFRFGSYGWSGGAQKELDELVAKNRMNWDFLDPVEFRGMPSDEDLKLVRQRGVELAQKVKETCGA